MKKNIVEFAKLTLWAKVPGSEKSARMVWSIANNQPRVTVFTGSLADKGFDGILNANMDPSVFYMFLSMLADVARNPDETKHKIEFTSTRKNDNGMQDVPMVSSLYFGKSSSGICWISLVEANKSKIMFEFVPPDWTKFYKSTGEQFTKAECSVANCLAFAKLAEVSFGSLISMITMDNFNRPPLQSSDTSFQTTESFDITF